jgi:hypothetical protein
VLAAAWVICAGAVVGSAAGGTTQALQLVFDPNNHPPEWDNSTPKEQSGSVEKNIHFTVRANDPDNDPITYSLSGLPKGAKAEALEGAIAVSWSPTADDVGVYHVVATATDGRNKIDREIRLVIEDEHESFFMPGIGASFWVPGSPSLYGVFAGFSVEFLGVRWVHLNDKRGPSHGRIYLAFDVLFSSANTPSGANPVDPVFMPVLGVDLSLERNPARRFLIPYFGLDGGALFQKQITTLGFMTAYGGVHFYSSRNVEIGLKAGYMFPFTSEQFGQVAGFRARLTADISFW